MKSVIEGNGGTILLHPSWEVSFLVQGWADDPCDDRLEECCALDIVAVPFQYLLHCVEQQVIVPFEEWSQLGPNSSSFLNPINCKSLYSQVLEAGSDAKFCCVLGARHKGNMDIRCRESEEINQSMHEHIGQNWPTLGYDGRTTIYIQPLFSSPCNSDNVPADSDTAMNGRMPSHKSTSVSLLNASSAFLAAYFQCPVRVLDALPIAYSRQGAVIAGQSVRVWDSHDQADAVKRKKKGSKSTRKRSSAAGGEERKRLLDVLDLLDVVQPLLPPDGYCIMGITDELIYEWDGAVDGDNTLLPPAEDECLHGLLRGRAFGGSRIAVFSTACYGLAMAADGGCDDKQAAGHFAYQLSTMAHEAMHCFGLDHCGLYTCCMNAWCDEIREFAKKPQPNRKQLKFEGDDVIGCLHICPICLRKLQITCGFDFGQRYQSLRDVYVSLGLEEQANWCKAVIRIANE